MVTGLVAAAVLLAIRLARQPRLVTALLLGVVIGAGGLTKPTAWVAVVVLPFTLLLFDYASPLRRRGSWSGSGTLPSRSRWAMPSRRSPA